MIKLTEAAVEAIYREKKNLPEHVNSLVLFTLTLGAEGSKNGIDYNIGLIKEGTYEPEDYESFQQDGLTILVNKEYSTLVEGTTVSFHIEEKQWWHRNRPVRQGFRFDNPVLKDKDFLKSSDCLGCGN